MFKSRTAKRFRAVALALGITLLTNYAISFAARSGSSTPPPPDTPRPTLQLMSGSSTPPPPDTPRP